MLGFTYGEIACGVLALIIAAYYWARLKGLPESERKMQVGVLQAIGAAALYFWIKDDQLNTLAAILLWSGIAILTLLGLGNFFIGVMNVASKSKNQE